MPVRLALKVITSAALMTVNLQVSRAMIHTLKTNNSVSMLIKIDPKLDAVTQLLVYSTRGGEKVGENETVLAAKVAAKQAVYETMAKMPPHFSTAWTLKTMLPFLAHIDNFNLEVAEPDEHHKG